MTPLEIIAGLLDHIEKLEGDLQDAGAMFGVKRNRWVADCEIEYMECLTHGVGVRSTEETSCAAHLGFQLVLDATD